MKKAIILGGGFAGFTWAHLLAKRGWKTVIVEKDVRPGGGIKTLWHNGHPYTHGPRHFIGRSDRAFEYIDAMAPQRRITHYARTYVGRDDAFYTYPPHLDDVAAMPDAGRIRAEMAEAAKTAKEPPRNFEEKWVGGVGETLYRKFADAYTRKHWRIPTTTLVDDHTYSGIHADAHATLRTGPHESFPGAHVSYPRSIAGWDDYFARIAAEDGVETRYGAEIAAFDLENRAVRVGDEKLAGDLLVSTLSPDVVSGGTYGPLPYAGRTMSLLMLPLRQVFPDDVYFLYYAGEEPQLRAVEYKKFTGYESPSSLVGIEYPAHGPRDYPYPFKAEMERADRYIRDLPKGVISVGRQGRYRYRTLSDIVDEALEQSEDY
jgi:UDP-galactopyranose mutase